MARRWQRRKNPRQRLVNKGCFLELEQRLLDDDAVGLLTQPSRLGELETTVANAMRKDHEKTILDLLASMVTGAARDLIVARVAVRQPFRQDDGVGPLVNLHAAPYLVTQTAQRRQSCAEQHLLQLISFFVKTKASLARTRRTESKVEAPALRVVPAGASSTAREAKAI